MRFLIAAALFLSVAAVRAHEGHEGAESHEPSPQEMAKNKAGHLEKALQLTPDQKAKVQKVIEDSAAEMLELQKKLQKLERETHEKVRVLLTDEQKEKFDMMRAQTMLMGRPGGPGMGPMGHHPRGQAGQGGAARHEDMKPGPEEGDERGGHGDNDDDDDD